MRNGIAVGGCVVLLAAVCSPLSGETVAVMRLLPPTGSPVADAWYLSDMRGDGTAAIVDTSGWGGDLENNQPLPKGVCRLTTGFSNGDKAEVGTFQDFGDAGTVLRDIDLSYSYHKKTVSGGNIFAAPSLKLAIYAEGGTGDNYGFLVYEPTWNQGGGGSQAVPADAWQDVTIDETTGAGDDSSGGWWWSGGFELPSGAGGPPISSLAEWADDFTASDPDDFANARVVELSVGVGTYNQGQEGYFDAVGIRTGEIDKLYDFEVPEPVSALAVMLGVGALGGYVRRRKA